MKKNITTGITTLLAFFTLASCSKDLISGSATVISEERDISGFTAVETDGSTDVFITQGNIFSVTVKAYNNLVPQLRTMMESGPVENLLS